MRNAICASTKTSKVPTRVASLFNSLLCGLVNDGRRTEASASATGAGLFLRGSGGLLTWKFFKFRVSEMPFPGL